VKPKLGVVYHYKDDEGMADAVRNEYQGPLVIGKDLMTIDIDKAVMWYAKSSAVSTTRQPPRKTALAKIDSRA